MPARRALQSQSGPRASGSTLAEIFAAGATVTVRRTAATPQPNELSVPMTFTMSMTEAVRDLVRASIRNSAPLCPVCRLQDEHARDCTFPRLVAHLNYLHPAGLAQVQPGEEE